MTPPSRPIDLFLLFHHSLRELVGSDINLANAGEHGCLTVIPSFSATALVQVPAGYQLHRYLDRFFLILPTNHDDYRQKAIDDFFNWLAPRYEKAIDVDGNIRNITRLLSMLQVSGDGPSGESCLLDFGCGTGLSVGPVAAVGAKVIGFDTCPIMRRIASSRGMKLIDQEEFLSSDEPSVAGVFASYVLHFEPAAVWIEAAWRRLRDGGVFAGNFHKGEGLEYFRGIMKGLGAIIEVAFGAPCGPYISCRKQGKAKW